MKRVLALDIGDKRIGVAVSDTLGILATPLTILERQGEDKDVSSVIDLVKKLDAGQIVAGMPRSLNGRIGHQAQKVMAFVEILKRQTEVPVVLRDESFTSLTAQQLMREAGTKKRKEKTHDDAAAAAVLLQSYLEEKALGLH